MLAICQNEEIFFRASRLVLASSLCMSCVRLRLFFSFSRFAPRVRFRASSLVFASSSCTSSVKQRTLFFFALRSSCSRLRSADVVDGVCVFFRFSSFFFLPSPSFKFELTRNKNEQNLFALRSRLLFAIVFVERDKHVLFFLALHV